MALDVRAGAVVRSGEPLRLPRTPRPRPLSPTARPRTFGDQSGVWVHPAGGIRAAPAADSIRIPGSPLILTKGEPVRITVHNRLTIPISVHWHGIELDSYFDGVGGFSGAGKRIAPMIAPRDSFVVRFTPPRAGTYMYHVHGERGEELASGLYAPSSCRPGDAVRSANGASSLPSPTAGRARTTRSSSTDQRRLIRWSSSPARRTAFGMIYISSDDVYMTTLRGPAGLPLARSFGARRPGRRRTSRCVRCSIQRAPATRGTSRSHSTRPATTRSSRSGRRAARRRRLRSGFARSERPNASLGVRVQQNRIIAASRGRPIRRGELNPTLVQSACLV